MAEGVKSSRREKGGLDRWGEKLTDEGGGRPGVGGQVQELLARFRLSHGAPVKGVSLPVARWRRLGVGGAARREEEPKAAAAGGVGLGAMAALF